VLTNTDNIEEQLSVRDRDEDHLRHILHVSKYNSSEAANLNFYNQMSNDSINETTKSKYQRFLDQDDPRDLRPVVPVCVFKCFLRTRYLAPRGPTFRSVYPSVHVLIPFLDFYETQNLNADLMATIFGTCKDESDLQVDDLAKFLGKL